MNFNSNHPLSRDPSQNPSANSLSERFLSFQPYPSGYVKPEINSVRSFEPVQPGYTNVQFYNNHIVYQKRPEVFPRNPSLPYQNSTYGSPGYVSIYQNPSVQTNHVPNNYGIIRKAPSPTTQKINVYTAPPSPKQEKQSYEMDFDLDKDADDLWERLQKRQQQEREKREGQIVRERDSELEHFLRDENLKESNKKRKKPVKKKPPKSRQTRNSTRRSRRKFFGEDEFLNDEDDDEYEEYQGEKSYPYETTTTKKKVEEKVHHHHGEEDNIYENNLSLKVLVEIIVYISNAKEYVINKFVERLSSFKPELRKREAKDIFETEEGIYELFELNLHNGIIDLFQNGIGLEDYSNRIKRSRKARNSRKRKSEKERTNDILRRKIKSGHGVDIFEFMNLLSLNELKIEELNEKMKEISCAMKLDKSEYQPFDFDKIIDYEKHRIGKYDRFGVKNLYASETERKRDCDRIFKN